MFRTPARTVLSIALAFVVLCSLTAALAYADRTHTPFQALYLLRGWQQWDADWYLGIAQHGYWYRPGQQAPVVYFPAYPLAIAGVMRLLGSPLVSAVLVTVASGLGALVLFTRWAGRLADEETTRWAAVLLAVYPFSFYLYGAAYSDALFLLLVVAAFLLLERGQLGWAVLVGALATAARPVAPALVLGLVARRLEWKRARGERWTWVDLLPVLSAAGLAAYLAYQWHAFGDPMAWVKAQASPGWDQQPGWRTWLKLKWFYFVTHESPLVVFRLSAHAALTLVALALVPQVFKRLGWGYGLYTLAMVGMPALGSKDFMGMGRYLLASFPLFLTLALLLRERPGLRRALVFVGAPLVITLAGFYGGRGYVS